MLVVKLFTDTPKPQSGGTYLGWEVSPLCGCELNIKELLPTYHRFAVGKFNQVRKSYKKQKDPLKISAGLFIEMKFVEVRAIGRNRPPKLQ